MEFAPKKLEEFIGQDKIKRSIEVSIVATKKRKEAFPHILLYGGSGLGKTTLANIIAKEYGKKMYTFLAPALENHYDVYDVIRDIGKGQFVFIDEIHALPKKLQEAFFVVMTDFKLEYYTGYWDKVNPFTLIGATTNLGDLANPFRERFGFMIQLEAYTVEEIGRIININVKRNKLKVTPDAIKMIANSSRKNPRTANRLLQRCRDTQTYNSSKDISTDTVEETLSNLQIDENGLTTSDLLILNTLTKQFDTKPTGIKSLALSTNLDIKAIELVYEPMLLELGLLERTPKGRLVTEKGVAYIA